MKSGKKICGKLLMGAAIFGMMVTTVPVPAGFGTETVYAAWEKKYEVNGNVLQLKPDMIREYGIATCIGEAGAYVAERADETTKYTIKVPAGTYDLESTIPLGSYVKLDLKDVTLVSQAHTGNMLVLDWSHDTKGYGDGTEGNSEVSGGTFIGNNGNTSSMIRMAHAKNITFDGCTFVGGGCAHQMEVASIDGFVVKNCVFRDAKGNGTQEKQEALQIDIPCSQYVFKSVELDGTPMKNVTVTGCTFKNVLRGLGTHSMLVGVYHENMNITNNTFENVDGECIVGLNYRNCKITGNTIKNCGAGILFQNFKPNVKAVYATIYDGKQKINKSVNNKANVTISNNTISLSTKKHPDEEVGIKVYGYELKKNTKATGIGSKDVIPKGDYCVDGVTIKKNVIRTTGHGIHLLHVSNANVEENTITNTNKKSQKDGIFVEFGSKNLIIKRNKILDAGRYGIFMKDESIVKKITKNTIKGAGSFGIGLYEGSQVTGEISANVISNTKGHGISVSKKCFVKTILKNTVKGCKDYPIFINTTSKKKMIVKGNKLQAGKNKKKIVVLDGKVKLL